MGKNRLLAGFDYIFVLRPMLFFPGWSTLMAGFYITSKQRLILPHDPLNLKASVYLLELFAVFALAMGASFLLNQIADVDSDLKNKKLFIVSEGYLSKFQVGIETLVLLVLSVAGGFLLSFQVGLLVSVFILLTGYMYNYRPFIMKDHPLPSLIANGLMGWLAFAIGWVAVQDASWALVYDAFPYFFLNTALYFYTTLPDADGDRRSHKNTFAVILGIEKLLILAFMFYMASVISAIVLKDWTALLILTLAAPFISATLWKRTIQSAVRATKFTILFFALIMCLKWPLYFILMVIGFYSTRRYFKLRFNFDYPNFRGN